MARTARISLLAGLVALAASGCSYYRPGGHGFSNDGPYTYYSTAHMPQTLTLKDTRTDEVLWTVEAPVGTQLVVRFARGSGEGPRPDVMRWEIMPLGQQWGSLDNEMPVPPASARLIEASLRPTPEFPDDVPAVASAQPATEPAARPAGAPTPPPPPASTSQTPAVDAPAATTKPNRTPVPAPIRPAGAPPVK